MVQNKFIVIVAALLIIGSMSMFTVNETEKAIKFQLGEIVKYDYKPGLHFKIPLYNNIKKFDARILTLDTKPERFLTAEKKNVIVDSFVKWRIGDVKTFYTAVAGDIDQANLRLEQIIKDAFRGEFSKRNIKQLVSAERSVIRNVLIETAGPLARELGIKIIDAQVRRIDLPDEVSNSVYRRMEAERARVASEFRSQGAEAAERIRADADRQREVKLANAYRDAEKLRGEGDAKSAEIYAKAYGEDAEFFSFYRSMSAYQKTFKHAGDKLIIGPDSDFFKYFKKEQ
ncbi:MAG: protease modulator HflC [Gammaproteobacteria bacterium]